jgi:hypothetical protein
VLALAVPARVLDFSPLHLSSVRVPLREYDIMTDEPTRSLSVSARSSPGFISMGASFSSVAVDIAQAREARAGAQRRCTEVEGVRYVCAR